MRDGKGRRRASTRREFLKTGAATLAGGMLTPAGAATAGNDTDTCGVLVDLTRCIGCRACENACRVKQGQDPLPPTNRGYGPGEGRLSFTSWTFVDFTEIPREQGNPGRIPVPVKKQCMHCLDPACASACPVAALYRTPQGAIAYRESRCLGCRYCMVACPFGVPRYEWSSGLAPRVGKCDFCDDRLAAGLPPACVSACPTGTLKFGKRTDLVWEARARQASRPARYPVLFGEKEVGGTAWIYLSDLPLEKLGFPPGLPDFALPALTWKALTKIPFVILGLGLILGLIAKLRHAKGLDE